MMMCIDQMVPETGEMLRDVKQERRQALPQAFLRDLPVHLAAPKAVLYDKQDPALIYVFEVTHPHNPARKPGKLAVKIGFYAKVRGADGARSWTRVNAARTAGYIEPRNLRDARYKVLDGAL